MALSNIETFHLDSVEADHPDEVRGDFGHFRPEGWYYTYSSPGCLSDSQPVGPFGSEEEAREDACTYGTVF